MSVDAAEDEMWLYANLLMTLHLFVSADMIHCITGVYSDYFKLYSFSFQEQDKCQHAH